MFRFGLITIAFALVGCRSGYEPIDDCGLGFILVPAGTRAGESAEAFCVAKYEMKILGDDNGDQPFNLFLIADSRPTGTPWVQIADEAVAADACSSMGAGYAVLTNEQWQSIARNIERTASNWNSGVIGVGDINRGHADGDPNMALASADDSDPCTGTGQPDCANPTHLDYAQKRTHRLSNGEIIWDFSGNAWERVADGPNGPDGLWQRFDSPNFTSNAGWEKARESFAPEGPLTSANGIGNYYGGGGRICRGGAYNYVPVSQGGSEGEPNTGIFSTHHNCWDNGADRGFRCTYPAPG